MYQKLISMGLPNGSHGLFLLKIISKSKKRKNAKRKKTKKKIKIQHEY